MSIEPLIQLAGTFKPGTVALVGAGPGDSALISVRGAARLAEADVVLHDKLIGPELLEIPRPEAERIFVGKWRGQHIWTQEEINAALVKHASAGRRVVRLKGGDPFVFGRGGEEAEYLAAAGIPYEVIPGITAAFGAPASAGIPLTHRGLSRSFALVTGHASPDDEPLDFNALAKMETIVFYMGMKHLEDNCDRLMEAGLDVRTPAAVIHWGTRPEQRTLVGTLGDIADRVAAEGIAPPALVLIGQVVRMREKIEWFEKRPLHGRTVAVTRMTDQAAGLAGPLQALGAEIIVAPTIEYRDVEDTSAFDQALGSLSAYDWLVLTSVNGVNALFRRIEALGGDSRWLAGLKVAAIGSATTDRLRERGVRPDLVPAEAVGEALSEALIAEGVAEQSVLLLRGDLARRDLPAALEGVGAQVDDLVVYRTVCSRALPESLLTRFDAGRIDWLTVTSPSSFKNLLTLLGPERRPFLGAIRLASIGPVSTQAIRDASFVEAVEADPHDVEGLIQAIVAYEARRS
jgi:uroporphyrinogen III methyltransferase/synthase